MGQTHRSKVFEHLLNDEGSRTFSHCVPIHCSKTTFHPPCLSGWVFKTYMYLRNEQSLLAYAIPFPIFNDFQGSPAGVPRRYAYSFWTAAWLNIIFDRRLSELQAFLRKLPHLQLFCRPDFGKQFYTASLNGHVMFLLALTAPTLKNNMNGKKSTYALKLNPSWGRAHEGSVIDWQFISSQRIVIFRELGWP